MSPYAAGPGWEIHHGDARDLLPHLELAGVAVTISDPPYNETSLTWDSWPAGWPTVVAATTPTSAPLWCFGSMRMFMDRADDFAGWSMAQDPPHTGDIGESTYTSVDGGPRLQRSVIEVRSCHGYAIHPTQKPTGIIDPLIAYSCPVGGLVLDPFCGSGSTLEAAIMAGRRAVGIEADEQFCEKAADRLSSNLFGVPA